jgi:pyruvate/2-oxoglutarate dehydrogenase complex dihydrolipoamide acyltransferase (E2) component
MDIRMDEELWATAMAPQGLLERWRVTDGAQVQRGDSIAEVRIEGGLHDIVAPDDGQIVRLASDGALVEPGTVIARLEARGRAPD